MFTSHKQISPPSLVLKLKISEVSQKWIPKAVELKRIPTHKTCKCKKFCSQTRLVGEIYSSDVIMHRGYWKQWFHYSLCENAQCPFRTFTTKNPVFYIYIYIFPFFVLTTNICNILVQPLLICSSLKTDACKSGLAQNLASLYYLFHFSFSSFKTTLLQTGVHLWIYFKF